MLLLSIIIPVYNVDKYIGICFDSIYSQDITDDQFEIITINDGSTDNSLQEIKKYALLHKNIFIIDKNNEGVSIARNIGIKHASGEYVTFVDPDDALLPNSLSQLIHFLRLNEVELVILRSFVNEQTENYNWKHIFKDEAKIPPMTVLNNGYVRGSVCGCAFSKNFINSNRLRFLENMKNGEDTSFMFFALYYAKNICFKNIKYYNVIGRESSASKTFTIERLKSNLESIKLVEKAILKTKYNSNSPILEYLKYLLCSTFVYTALKVPNVTFGILKKMGFCEIQKINTNGIVFQQRKIRIFNTSKRVFYLLSWIKSKI